MASIGKPLDRVDGQAEGHRRRAKYAAEFAVPGVVHAVLVQSTIGAGEITGFRSGRRAKSMPGVLAIITPDNAPKLLDQEASAADESAPLLQDNAFVYNGQHVAVVVADSAGSRLGRGARCACATMRRSRSPSMDAVLGQAYVPKHFRNGERPPDSNRGDPAGAFDVAR